MEKQQIQFKPLSDGLGFHPFSDGLPYAPVTKAPRAQSRPQPSYSRGSGAVAAGPPSYARVTVPVAAQTRARVTAPALAVQPQASAIAATAEPTFGLGYLLKRLMAFLFDTVVNTGLCAGGMMLILMKENLEFAVIFNPALVAIAAVFLSIFNWALTAAQEVAFGTSLGKRIFGLRIQGGAFVILMRSVCFLPSLVFCAMGILWAVFDRRKRCWHDVATGVQPMEIARL